MIADRTATGARRNLDTTMTHMAAHPFAPYVKQMGIGVTDLAVSKAFYENVMGLQYLSSEVKTDRVEEILEDNRAENRNTLALMHYNATGISYLNHPVKLVFAVPDADAYYQDIVANGGRAFSPPAVQPGLGKIGMALDPDG